MKPRDNKKIIRITGKMILTGLIVVLFWLGSLGGIWYLAKNRFLKATDQISPTSSSEEIYSFLNPRLQREGFDSIEERQAKMFVSLIPLRALLFQYLEQAGIDKENIGFYIEDLNTGAWSGWQERTEFIPASLLKVPIAAGVMKKIDEGSWTLDTAFLMDSRYKDKSFGNLWQAEDGTPLTIKELLREMLQNSDNTASNIIFDVLLPEEREAVYYHIGIINPEAPISQSVGRPLFLELAPRNLAAIFRSVYNAVFLTRRSSNYILELLTETKFDETLAYEIPKEIKVAHKVAHFTPKDTKAPKNYHDCGIVFYPDHPYLYCLMTKEYKAETASSIIVNMANKIYQYFSAGGKI